MAMAHDPLRLGKRIAPPRFLLFAILFVVATAASSHALGIGRAVLASFDGASLIFLVSIAPLLGRGEANQIRAQAARNDANRAVLLGLTGVVMLVVLVAVAKELQGKNDTVAIVLVVATLVLAWLFANAIYTLHYAHLYYGDANGRPGDDRGLDFPHCDEPDYWDFLYFSFTLGMTFQTSDVEITSRRVRGVVLGHTMLAFVFNLGVLAFTINVIGGG
ncbi:DUF1345 domain-containing protein [Sphingomonas bacterium]|uniref:DUF1345 domain-containing protein n=1 Tax=Sphingomonas bacterium TaxID=1895847 RepID=UPI003F68B5B0